MGKKGEELIKVPMDEVGKAAEHFMEIKEDRKTLGGKLKKAEEALVVALNKAKRESISAKGHVLKIKVVASKTKIVVS